MRTLLCRGRDLGLDKQSPMCKDVAIRREKSWLELSCLCNYFMHLSIPTDMQKPGLTCTTMGPSSTTRAAGSGCMASHSTAVWMCGALTIQWLIMTSVVWWYTMVDGKCVLWFKTYLSYLQTGYSDIHNTAFWCLVVPSLLFAWRSNRIITVVTFLG